MNLLRSPEEKLAVFDSPTRRATDFAHVLSEGHFYQTEDAEKTDPVILLTPVGGKKDYEPEYVAIGGRRHPPLLDLSGVHVFLVITRTRLALVDTSTKELYQLSLRSIDTGETSPSGAIQLVLTDGQKVTIKFKTPGSKLASFAWNVAAMGFEAYEDSRAEKSRSPKYQHYGQVDRKLGSQKANAIGFMDVFAEFFRLCAYLPEPDEGEVVKVFRSIPASQPSQAEPSARKDQFARR